MSKPFAEFLEWANQVETQPRRNPFKSLFKSNGKRCQICNTLLRNPKSTFCSKGCICVYMTALAMSPAYYQQRAEQRQKRRVTIHCKTCGKDMGKRKPGIVKFCSRECVGRDPTVRDSKAKKRKALWQDPAYRADMTARARVQVADPSSRFGKPHPSP